MNKLHIRNKQGFSLVEALLTLSIFALMVTSFVGAIFYGQESAVISGISSQATSLAEEGLEAVRNIRDDDFSNLTNGIHGLSFSGGQWSFSGSFDSIDSFSRSIEINEVDQNTKLATSVVSWSYGLARSGEVSISTELSNWRKYNPTQAEQLIVDVSNVEIGGIGNVDLTGMTIENIGIENIVIASTEISWSGVPSNRTLDNIDIDGSSVWSGNDNSGSSQNIDYTLNLGQIDPMDLTFSAAVNGISVTIIFTMEDGSIVQVSFTIGSPADTTKPNNVTDLSVSGTTGSSLNLSWTAAGDDGNSGTASSYDIRYSTSVITNGNWSSSIQVSGEPMPASAGSSESMTVSGLSSSVTYYFAIKTSDEASNVSGLSNVASGTTTSSPQANYLIVNTAGATLSQNNKNVYGITLQNSGPSNITITSIATSWSGVASNRKLKKIRINNSDVWSGDVSSGTNNNIADVTILSGGSASIDRFRFSKEVSVIVLNLTFHMSDGSSKSVSGIGPLN